MSHLLSIRLQVCLRKLRRLLRSLMSFQAVLLTKEGGASTDSKKKKGFMDKLKESLDDL